MLHFVSGTCVSTASMTSRQAYSVICTAYVHCYSTTISWGNCAPVPSMAYDDSNISISTETAYSILTPMCFMEWLIWNNCKYIQLNNDLLYFYKVPHVRKYVTLDCYRSSRRTVDQIVMGYVSVSWTYQVYGIRKKSIKDIYYNKIVGINNYQ